MKWICFNCGADNSEAYDWCQYCETDMNYKPKTPRDQELAAVAHVQQRIEQDGAHDVTGCPRYCRAMCDHGTVIRRMKDDGIWPEHIPT